MLHLPHFSYRAPQSIASFLSGARTLNPTPVTLVEKETGYSVADGGFVARFMDSLHHFSAIYDSLEAGFPMQRQARAPVQNIFLGPRIANSLARIYRSRGEGEEASSWGKWLGEAGFVPAKKSFSNHCQAKLLVGLFNDGYRMDELANDRLVLSWKSRRLLSASIWVSSSPSSSSSDSGSWVLFAVSVRNKNSEKSMRSEEKELLRLSSFQWCLSFQALASQKITVINLALRNIMLDNSIFIFS